MDDQISVWEAKAEHKEKLADASEDKWEESKDVFSSASESF